MPSRRRRRRSTPTPADIWRILDSMAREARQEKARRREEDARHREEDARRREEDARRSEQEEQWRKEWEERHRALDRKLNRIAGDGDIRWGELMEALVEGNLRTLFRSVGVETDYVTRRAWSSIRGVRREYDLVAAGETDAVVVEAKTTLRQADIPRFEERLGDFRTWRPDHARERLRGAFGYLTVQGEADRVAEAAGFYLIRAVSGSARLVNSAGFEPRIF